MCTHARTQVVMMGRGGVSELRVLCTECGDSRPATKAEWRAWREQVDRLTAPSVVHHRAGEYQRRAPRTTRRLDYATYRERLRSRAKPREAEHA